MAQFSDSKEIFDESHSWQWRVIRASLGTTTGLIVMAMLGQQPKKGIAFGETCNIRLDGLIETKMRKNGTWYPPTVVGTVEAVRDNVRRLCDHCRLSDGEREAVFVELRKWIGRDHRATSGVLDGAQA